MSVRKSGIAVVAMEALKSPFSGPSRGGPTGPAAIAKVGLGARMASDLLLSTSRLLLRSVSFGDVNESGAEAWTDLVELVQLFARACGATSGSLLIVDRGRLVDAAAPGLAGTPLSRGLSGAAVRDGEQLVVRSTADDRRYDASIDGEAGSLACLPVRDSADGEVRALARFAFAKRGGTGGAATVQLLGAASHLLHTAMISRRLRTEREEATLEWREQQAEAEALREQCARLEERGRHDAARIRAGHLKTEQLRFEHSRSDVSRAATLTPTTAAAAARSPPLHGSGSRAAQHTPSRSKGSSPAGGGGGAAPMARAATMSGGVCLGATPPPHLPSSPSAAAPHHHLEALNDARHAALAELISLDPTSEAEALRQLVTCLPLLRRALHASSATVFRPQPDGGPIQLVGSTHAHGSRGGGGSALQGSLASVAASSGELINVSSHTHAHAEHSHSPPRPAAAPNGGVNGAAASAADGSVLCLPVTSRYGVLAVLQLTRSARAGWPGPFDGGDEAFALQVGAQLRTSLGGAVLADSYVQQRDASRTLLRLARRACRWLHAPSVCDAATAELAKLVAADDARVYVVRWAARSLHPCTDRPPPTDEGGGGGGGGAAAEFGGALPLERSVEGRAALESRAVTAATAAEEEEEEEEVEEEEAAAHERSPPSRGAPPPPPPQAAQLLCVPILDPRSRRAIAVARLVRRGGVPFAADDATLARHACELLGLCLRNALLHAGQLDDADDYDADDDDARHAHAAEPPEAEPWGELGASLARQLAGTTVDLLGEVTPLRRPLGLPARSLRV